jgi:hypothetical protein
VDIAVGRLARKPTGAASIKVAGFNSELVAGSVGIRNEALAPEKFRDLRAGVGVIRVIRNRHRNRVVGT